LVFLRNYWKAEFFHSLTFRGFAMVGQSKHKSSILHKSSIEEIMLNFAVLPHYCKTLVSGSFFFISRITLY